MMHFKYTKDDGKVSERDFIPLVTPKQKNYFGIDVTELEPTQQESFAYKIFTLKTVYETAISQLMAEYDIKNNFRSFCPEKMSEIVNG